MSKDKCNECIYHNAKVDQSSCWTCTNYDLFRKKDDNIVKPISYTKLEDMYPEIKKNFNYKDTDSTVYTSETLNQHFNKWLKEIKRNIATNIFEEIEKVLSEKYELYVFDNRDIEGIEQDAIIDFADTMKRHFAELKKKYTGENHETK